ncbi:uncharacterized protein LOC129601866 isoform X2 [Paramacrobiotus metropolitanus]|uniref:uncharacterized protein LOC129601866 isoform X2 n=1 Tax=Paramacrobiotus metropolitanus TaxID=2943436 RepID=UPI00244635F9|nr:uncharacterized protein LOC129601866 isoform X2 [Paramacrobiotus metropolitanus]
MARSTRLRLPAHEKKERKRFIKWFRKERRRHNNQFDFNAHFIGYCSQDVLVLQQACEKFRTLFQQVTNGLCPFASGLTTPGMCNYFWRARMLKKNQIALIGPPGQGKKSSAKGDRWLRWIEMDNDIQLQREVRIGPWTVDGFDPRNKTVYEFLGCMWHGCSDCTTKSTLHPFLNRPMEEINKATDSRLDAIKAMGYALVSIWEHEYDARLAADMEFKQVIELANIEEPMHPRDAFTGGRTNAIKLYHKCAPGEKIYSLDVISEYPYINKNLPYPVGAPVIITKDFPPVESIFGVMKCRIIPPPSLFLPVLPYRTDKLTFPLCAKCVQERVNTPCCHEDDDRALEGTWCTPEIHRAIEAGYRIEKIYSVWHYPEQMQYLFREYIDLFLKLKTEASGYPPNCRTEEDKDRYIEEFLIKENILLDKNNIAKNDGLRALSKLMLNSFWGKFGQQEDRSNTAFVEKKEIFHDYLFSNKYEVAGFDLVTDEVMAVQYRSKKDYIPTSKKTNVVIAAFTTAYARLHLLKFMEMVGDRLLYHDTGNIFYIHTDDLPDPPVGTCLGDLSSSLEPNEHINEFVALGPKSYAYRTNTGNETIKVKGFTLTRKARKQLNLESLKEMLLESLAPQDQPNDVTVNYPFNITRNKRKLEVSAKEINKRFRLTYSKRRIVDTEFNTRPWGDVSVD